MRAILLCAGQGVRFQPLSLVRPKPLTPVQGAPLVEHCLRLLHEHGVHDIIIVVGYMREQFSYLVEKYDVTLCYNSLYATHNNYASLACVADLLDDSLIIDGDLWFTSDFFSRLRPGVSQFVSQPTTHGLEWELKTDADGRIVEVEKWITTGYGMVGVSYWTGKAARLLAAELLQCASDAYWEDAALRVIARTPVYVTRIPQGFVQEMDTLKDAMDFELLTHEEIAHLCSVDFNPVKLKGLTNNTWLIRSADYVLRTLRIPGKGTEAFIQREHEPVIIAQIAAQGITPATTFYPQGFKTTTFLDQHRITTFRDLHAGLYARLVAVL
ncbi:MAG: NTP transferase domain-containing protein, partial [Desulfovibrionaceae bacterium]